VFAGLHYECANCPTINEGQPRREVGCTAHTDHGGAGPCDRHRQCAKFVSKADAQWPEGQVAVFSVRGGSEGDYTHVEVHGQLLLLAKTFQGRDASWKFARNVADLLGI
jgi:hypothetical protein